MWPLKAFRGIFPRQVTLPDPRLACSPPPHATQCHSPVTDELQEGNFVQRESFASVQLHQLTRVIRNYFAFPENNVLICSRMGNSVTYPFSVSSLISPGGYKYLSIRGLHSFSAAVSDSGPLHRRVRRDSSVLSVPSESCRKQ